MKPFGSLNFASIKKLLVWGSIFEILILARVSLTDGWNPCLVITDLRL